MLAYQVDRAAPQLPRDSRCVSSVMMSTGTVVDFARHDFSSDSPSHRPPARTTALLVAAIATLRLGLQWHQKL